MKFFLRSTVLLSCEWSYERVDENNKKSGQSKTIFSILKEKLAYICFFSMSDEESHSAQADVDYYFHADRVRFHIEWWFWFFYEQHFIYLAIEFIPKRRLALLAIFLANALTTNSGPAQGGWARSMSGSQNWAVQPKQHGNCLFLRS